MTRITRENVERHLQYLNDALARRQMTYRYCVHSENDKLVISRTLPGGADEVPVVQGLSIKEAYSTVKVMYQVITDNTLAVQPV